MSFVHGSNTYVSIDGTDVSAYCDQQTLDKLIDMAETTAFGDSDKTEIAGVRSHTLRIGGPWDATLDGVMAGADDGADVAWIVGPAGSTTGLTKYSGNALISGYTISSSTSGRVEWSANFDVDGAVTRGTF